MTNKSFHKEKLKPIAFDIISVPILFQILVLATPMYASKMDGNVGIKLVFSLAHFILFGHYQPVQCFSSKQI